MAPSRSSTPRSSRAGSRSGSPRRPASSKSTRKAGKTKVEEPAPAIRPVSASANSTTAWREIRSAKEHEPLYQPAWPSVSIPPAIFLCTAIGQGMVAGHLSKPPQDRHRQHRQHEEGMAEPVSRFHLSEDGRNLTQSPPRAPKLPSNPCFGRSGSSVSSQITSNQNENEVEDGRRLDAPATNETTAHAVNAFEERHDDNSTIAHGLLTALSQSHAQTSVEAARCFEQALTDIRRNRLCLNGEDDPFADRQMPVQVVSLKHRARRPVAGH